MTVSGTEPGSTPDVMIPPVSVGIGGMVGREVSGWIEEAMEVSMETSDISED